jgi:ribonucleotide reductase beta subunit family protein with ferritin-like domain
MKFQPNDIMASFRTMKKFIKSSVNKKMNYAGVKPAYTNQIDNLLTKIGTEYKSKKTFNNFFVFRYD